jgi:hypothetical protein
MAVEKFDVVERAVVGVRVFEDANIVEVEAEVGRAVVLGLHAWREYQRRV